MKLRLTVLPWLLWALAIGLAMGFVMYAAKANAALNYRAQGTNGQIAGLRLSDAPCSYEKVLRHIKEQFHHRFKAAILTWGGRDWQSCYIEIEQPNQQGEPETVIFSVDEEGAPFAPIPKRFFREDSI